MKMILYFLQLRGVAVAREIVYFSIFYTTMQPSSPLDRAFLCVPEQLRSFASKSLDEKLQSLLESFVANIRLYFNTSNRDQNDHNLLSDGIDFQMTTVGTMM